MIRAYFTLALVALSLGLAAGCGTSPPPSEASDAAAPPKEQVANLSQSVSIDPKPADQARPLDSVVPNVFPLVGAKTHHQSNYQTASLSFDGTDYFAVWADQRAGFQTVYGAHISESGVVREPAGIRLSPLPPPRTPLGLFGRVVEKESLVSASSAAGGAAFWVERVAKTSDPILRGGVVDAKGNISQYAIERPTLSYRTNGSSRDITRPLLVAGDAAGFWLTYYLGNPKGGLDFVARRIVPGAEMGPVLTVLSALPSPIDYGISEPRFASTGDEALVAWLDPSLTGDAGVYSGIRYALVPSGKTFDLPPPNGDTPNLLGLSAVANEYRIAVRNTFDQKMKISSIASTGAITSASPPVTLATYAFGYAGVAPDPTADGFVVREQNSGNLSQICIRGLSSSGVLTPCATVPTDPARNGESLFGDHGFVVGKTTFGDSFYPSMGGISQATLSVISRATRAVVSDPVVSRAANREIYPSIATDGDGYLAVWLDTRVETPVSFGYPNNSVFAIRLDANGVAQGDAVRISEGEIWTSLTDKDIDTLCVPRVIFDGKNYFVAWGEKNAIRGAEIARSGAILPSKTISIPIGNNTYWLDLAVGSDSQNRLIAWWSQGDFSSSMVLLRVSKETGAVVDSTPQPLAPPGNLFRLTPYLEFDGKQTLVAWSELVDFSLAIVGVMVPDGDVKPRSTPFRIFDGSAFALYPRIASDGKNGFLVAWSQIAAADVSYDVFGKIVRPDGTTLGIDPSGKWAENNPLATIPIATGLSDQNSVDVRYARDDANYVATWTDNRSGNYDVYASWIEAADGVVRDPGGVAVASLPAFESAPALAMRNDGKGVVVYQEFSDDPLVNTYRLRVRSIDSGKLKGVACTIDDECTTRHCVEGICCDKGCNDGCGTCSATPGTCTPKPAETACGRLSAFKCDGTNLSCRASCETDRDCVSSFHCRNRLCEPALAYCEDETHRNDGNGNITDCGIYKCMAGQCRNPCVSIEDCTGNLICDFKGACVEPPPIANQEGCSTSANESPSWFSAAFMCIAAGVVARRVRNRKGGAR